MSIEQRMADRNYTVNGKEVKILSIAGAFPVLLSEGTKAMELRSWSTAWRGYVVFHCSSSKAYESSFKIFDVDPDECPKASLIGFAELVDVIRLDTEEKWEYYKEQHLRSDSFEEMLKSNKGKPLYGHLFVEPYIFDPITEVRGKRNYWQPKGDDEDQLYGFEYAVLIIEETIGED